MATIVNWGTIIVSQARRSFVYHLLTIGSENRKSANITTDSHDLDYPIKHHNAVSYFYCFEYKYKHLLNMVLPSQHNLDIRHYNITTTISTLLPKFRGLNHAINGTHTQLLRLNTTYTRTCTSPEWKRFYAGYLNEFTDQITVLEAEVRKISPETQKLIEDLVRVKWATLGYARMYDEGVLKQKLVELLEIGVMVREKYDRFVELFENTFRSRHA
ncbi:hypothetical protein DFH27DRAFT_637310 [Peziza echinospora]|nr:hypothetical protein DFH27DRAFT_637310 [Peziza echinospora]